MRLLKTKKQRMVFYIALFILGIGLYIPSQMYIDDETQTIFKKGEFSIGELTFFSESKGGRPPKPTQIGYTYRYSGNVYKNQYDEGVYKIPSSELKEGEKYLVICLNENPKKSRMLFNYPVKDSADFIKYMNKFRISRPKP